MIRFNTKSLTLTFHRCAGDLVVATAAIHSLLRAYPELSVSVESRHQALLSHDPQLRAAEGPRLLIDYVDYMGTGCNYAEAYCKDLAAKLSLPLTLTQEPKLYLSDEEKTKPYPGLPKEYVVCCVGSKSDMPVKQLPLEAAEKVIAKLDLPTVQIGLIEHNKPLKGAIDLRGQTNLRDVMRIAAHAQAGWGGDTFLWHCCCSLGTPYVVCASGRYAPDWLRIYSNMTLLTSFGQLDCCSERGCMLRRIVPLGDSFDSLMCQKPRLDMRLPVAECMTRITPEQICSAITKYL